MNKKNFILSIIVTSIVSIITVIITINILKQKENLPKQNDEIVDLGLIKIDSLMERRKYYNKLLESELNGDYSENSSGKHGFGPKALYIKKKIVEIDSKIKEIIHNDTIP